MLIFPLRLLYVLSNKIRRFFDPGKIPEEKWVADFSKPERFPFDIKTESFHDANPENSALFLGLKTANRIAWVEAPKRRFRDQLIEARFCLDSLGGYAAAGIMFRVMQNGTYYLALVSGKGYLRVDAVINETPRPLIGWTEIPDLLAEDIKLGISAFGDHLVFAVNGRWIAEARDSSVTEGHIGFALASYETGSKENTPYTCLARLRYLAVESRTGKIQDWYAKWNGPGAVPAESRFLLAETFAALDFAAPALGQLEKAWEQKELAARTGRELLLAGRMAARLEQYDEALEYLDACLEQGKDTVEAEAAAAEKIKILDELRQFPALKRFLLEQIARKNNDPALYAQFARTCRDLKEYEAAAAAWDRAFELDQENGSYPASAARVYMLLGKSGEALKRCLAGGRIFLRQDNSAELGALVPKLFLLGKDDWEAHALIGKWAFSIEDYEQAESEFVLSDTIRGRLRPCPPADPAASYLKGMLLSRKGRHREAHLFFDEAARLAPDYGLFRFRLAESRWLLSGKAGDPGLAADLEAALALMPEDGWLHNFAAQIRLAAENPDAADLAAAEQHLEKAASALGEIPEVQANRKTLRLRAGTGG